MSSIITTDEAADIVTRHIQAGRTDAAKRFIGDLRETLAIAEAGAQQPDGGVWAWRVEHDQALISAAEQALTRELAGA